MRRVSQSGVATVASSMRSLGLANGGERDLHHLSLDVKAFHA